MNTSMDIAIITQESPSKERIIFERSDLYESEFYLSNREPDAVQGWLLHIPAAVNNFPDVLNACLPVIDSQNVAFKIIKSLALLEDLNNGTLGNTCTAKAITIYPESDTQALQIALELIPLLRAYESPVIRTDYILAKNLFTRYGAYKIVKKDSFENVYKYLYNKSGELIKDVCTEPPHIPFAINIPFMEIIKNQNTESDDKILDGRFKVRQVLKKDYRVNVFLADPLKAFNKKAVVVKQGNVGMVVSTFGRGLKDRFQWERKVSEKLAGIKNVSKIKGYFEYNGKPHLEIERIPNTITLDQKAKQLLQSNIWWSIDNEKQIQIIKYLIGFVELVSEAHARGVVHRDITPTNILIDSDNTIYLIDWELSYDMEFGEPQPIFRLGTEGFMSPEQKESRNPSFQQDIYSIGATILSVTGVNPRNITAKTTGTLRKQFDFLIGNDVISSLIIDCIQTDPFLRPGTSQIIGFLKELTDPKKNIRKAKEVYSKDLILEIFTRGANGLFDASYLSNGLWHSTYTGDRNPTLNPMIDRHIYTNLHNGIAGVLLFLKQVEFKPSTETQYETLSVNLEYFKGMLTEQWENLEQGLHFGTAGISLLLKDHYPIINDPNENEAFIKSLLCRKAQSASILDGKAGQLIAALKYGLSEDEDIKTFIQNTVAHLLSSQAGDGSWFWAATGEKVLSFGTGIAGITYALYRAYEATKDELVLNAANKALKYLTRNTNRTAGKMWWPYSNKNAFQSDDWCNGTSGIALTYLKAYQVTGDRKFKLQAQQALDSIDSYFIHENLSLCFGLSGIGEVYVDAFTILGEEKYLTKAQFIASYIIANAFPVGEDIPTWYTEQQNFKVANLMLGTAGILHFLYRLSNSGSLSFPLI